MARNKWSSRGTLGTTLAVSVLVGVVAAVFVAPLVLARLATWYLDDPKLGMTAAKLVYSWPCMTGLCVVTFLMMFRVPLGEFLAGVRTLKVAGVEIKRAFGKADQQIEVKTRRVMDWLGDARSENRRTFRAWLNSEFGYGGSEVAWVYSVSEAPLDLAIGRFNIP